MKRILELVDIIGPRLAVGLLLVWLLATALLRPDELWGILPEALQAIAFCAAVDVLMRKAHEGQVTKVTKWMDDDQEMRARRGRLDSVGGRAPGGGGSDGREEGEEGDKGSSGDGRGSGGEEAGKAAEDGEVPPGRG